MQLSSDQVTAWEGCDLIWRGSWAAWESPGLQLSLTKLVGGGGGHHQCGRTVDTLHPFVFHTTLAPQPVRSYFNKSLTFGFCSTSFKFIFSLQVWGYEELCWAVIFRFVSGSRLDWSLASCLLLWLWGRLLISCSPTTQPLAIGCQLNHRLLLELSFGQI